MRSSSIAGNTSQYVTLARKIASGSTMPFDSIGHLRRASDAFGRLHEQCAIWLNEVVPGYFSLHFRSLLLQSHRIAREPDGPRDLGRIMFTC